MGGAKECGISRRNFLRAAGTLGVSGTLLGVHVSLVQGQEEGQGGDVSREGAAHSSHGGNETAGNVDNLGFDPSEFLRDFYRGEERREGGRTLREYELTAEDVEIEVAPGVKYPAWAYNGQVPGPTLRATEGERLRVLFKNRSAHPHTIHFHGFHPANMDGVFELVGPGEEFTYEFDDEPFGMHHPRSSMREAEGIKASWQRSVLLVSDITLHDIPEGLAIGVAFGAVASELPGTTLPAAIALALSLRASSTGSSRPSWSRLRGLSGSSPCTSSGLLPHALPSPQAT